MPKIPDFRFEISEAVLGLYLFTEEEFLNATEHTRPTAVGIDHICIESEPPENGGDKTISAVATNGHHLCHLSWVPDLSKDRVPNGTILISATRAKEFLKGKRPKGTRYWIVSEGGEWEVVADNGTRLSIGETPDDYPDWRRMMPKRPKRSEVQGSQVASELGFNWDYLDIFRRFSKRYLGQHGFRIVIPETDIHPVLMIPVGIELSRGPADRPIKTEVEYYLEDGITEMEYLLMPIRV